MKTADFVKYIWGKFKRLIIINTFLLLFANFIEGISVLSLVVMVDLFITRNLENSSKITRAFISVIKSLGFPATLSFVIGIFFVLTLIKIFLQIFSQYTIYKTKYAVLREMMVSSFEEFFNARWYFVSSSGQGKVMNLFIREITIFGDTFVMLSRYFSSIVQVVLYLIIPFCLSWQITAVSLFLASLFALPFLLLNKISYQLGNVNTATANQMGAVIHEGLGLAKIILGFSNQDKTIQGLNSAFEDHRRATIKSQTISFSIPLLYYPFALLVVIFGLYAAQRFSLSLSEIIVLFYSLVRVVPFIGNIMQFRNYLDSCMPSYEQLISLRQRAASLKQHSGEQKFTGFNKEINIEQLCFAYPGHSLILKYLNINIPKGKMVAFVGESGAGKSTLVDIIMGLNEPSSGSITFDGKNFREFNINSYRQRIGYVPQDSVLFNSSIRENLLWANDSASDSEIREACRLANAEEFILGFPNSYDTVVGDRGVRLSGGQVQRIALARAILRKPELLILDEATSSLDTHSERLIQQAIEIIVKETTVIVVAHRLSTIVNADYIYVLKEGRIAEEGTYLELVRMNGHFNHMVELQALEVGKIDG